MPKTRIPANIEHIPEGIDFIETTLQKYKIKRHVILETMLLCEENLVRLINQSPENSEYEIFIRHWYNTALISLSAKGDELPSNDFQMDIPSMDLGHDSEDMIRSILLQAYSEKISYTRKGEYNFIRINAGSKKPIYIVQTALALLFAVLLSIFLRNFLPQSIWDQMTEYVLIPFQTTFLNAVQLITAPTVFFSIMTSVSRYSSFSGSGKTTLRVIIGYTFTSVVAVLSSLYLFRALYPMIGSYGILHDYIQSSPTDTDAGSIYNIITNIVPSNIVSPFLNTNAIQLLIMAILGGLALGRAGNYSSMLKEIAESLNRFFAECVNIISNLIPAAVFLLTLLTALYFEWNSIRISVTVVVLTLLGLFVMCIWYLLLVLFIGHLNPLPFLAKSLRNIWNSFYHDSGTNLVSNTLHMCTRKLGIDSSLSSFSIPFGAIANMDGNCVYLTIAGMSMAHLCGVELLGRQIVSIIFMVVILSVGSSISPASTILAITMLMNQINASPIVISILLGTNVLIEIFTAICNNMGDTAITVVVASRSKLINRQIYSQK